MKNPQIFKKTFLRSDLICDDIELDLRIQLIEEISSNLDFIPSISFKRKDNIIIYNQLFVTKFKVKSAEIQLLERFSNDLDLLAQTKFVHGDIHQNNVIYDGVKLLLVDLEPAFLQLKNGKKVLKCSAPIRSQNDIINKIISIETDKIGFFLFCYKFLNIRYFINMTEREVLQRRKKGIYNFLPINESDFIKLSFNEIFQLFKLELSNL